MSVCVCVSYQLSSRNVVGDEIIITCIKHLSCYSNSVLRQQALHTTSNGQAPSSRTYHLSHPIPLAALYHTLLPFSRQHIRNYFSTSQAILSFVNMLNSASKNTRLHYEPHVVIFSLCLYSSLPKIHLSNHSL